MIVWYFGSTNMIQSTLTAHTPIPVRISGTQASPTPLRVPERISMAM